VLPCAGLRLPDVEELALANIRPPVRSPESTWINYTRTDFEMFPRLKNAFQILEQILRQEYPQTDTVAYGQICRWPGSPQQYIHRDGGTGIVLYYLQDCPSPLVFGSGGGKDKKTLHDVQKSSVVFLRGNTYHAGPANNTDREIRMLYVHGFY
jgi:hypothetical protein